MMSSRILCRRFVNYFTILRLPQSYDLDSTLLREKVRDLQKKAHPDKVRVLLSFSCIGIIKVGIIKGGCQAQSALINEAARALQSHHERGLHLCQGQNTVTNLNYYDRQGFRDESFDPNGSITRWEGYGRK